MYWYSQEEQNLKTLAAELGIEASVRFVGEVAYERLPDFFRVADIFILANRTLPSGDVEGFGIVFIEAGACEVPVIAGDSGGTADPVRHGINGFRVDTSCAENLVAPIITLIDDEPLRIRMGKEGRKIAEREYA